MNKPQIKVKRVFDISHMVKQLSASERMINMAQYVAKEFMNIDQLVTEVKVSDEPNTVIIIFEDGTKRLVSGKIAFDLKHVVGLTKNHN